MRAFFPVGLLVLISLPAAFCQPSISYSKYFKGSRPEFIAITVQRSGHATYQEAKDDDRPLQFQLSPSDAAQIFDLADKLDHFSHPLESPAKVAYMGIKTFRYEDGGNPLEVKFNYSQDPNAGLIADWFERITETEGNFIDLERAVKFDHLGVNQALLQIQVTYERKRLVAQEQFLPLLDRVSKNEVFMHMSRERAANLADAFRNTGAPKTDKASAEK